MSGSSRSRGDQACHWWKSSICANTSGAAAWITAERESENSAGTAARRRWATTSVCTRRPLTHTRSARTGLRLAHALQGAGPAAAGHAAVGGRIGRVAGGGARVAARGRCGVIAAAPGGAAARLVVVPGGLPRGGGAGAGDPGDVEQGEGAEEGADDDEGPDPAPDQSQSERSERQRTDRSEAGRPPGGRAATPRGSGGSPASGRPGSRCPGAGRAVPGCR